MENANAQGENDVSSNIKGNVMITEARAESKASTSKDSEVWSSLTSSDISGKYPQMTDRWLKVTTFKWKTNDSRNVDLVTLNLPLDVIKNEKWSSCQIPNTIPFRVHRYWRGDMEVKIQLNSNKFQIGQLQCVWYYEPDLDPKFNLRRFVEVSSQAEHVLISAGSSNEACMDIVYKHHMPMISTKKRADIMSPLSLGKLFIRVLNPLSVISGGPVSCNGSIFVRFKNCEFTGQIDGSIDDIAHHQMDTFARAAMGALNAISTPNMDNPPFTSNPRYLVPTASHSWSYGTGTAEPIHSLRLDSRGQTQHPDNNNYELSIKSIVSRFGLVRTIEWRDDNESGTLLFSCDAAPLMERKQYLRIPGILDTELDKYAIPPVGVISSLYNYWRGSLEYRFDIIATQFHTGRLIVGYVPGATEQTPVTLDNILAGPHVVFTLQESQQFSYEIPYIADRPFWNRRYLGNYFQDSVLSPSRIYMFVLNPLIPMQSVVKKIYINVYQRGGTSFEVSIPVQPSLGLGYNALVLYDKTELIFALTGYSPYYAGTYYKFMNSKGLVMRYGQTSGQVAYFDSKWLRYETSTLAVYYYYEIQHLGDAPKYYDDNKKAYIPCQFAVGIYDDINTKSMLLVPVRTEDDAINFTVNYVHDGFDPKNCKQYVIPFVDTSSNTYSDGNPGWIVKRKTLIQTLSSDEDDYGVPQNETQSTSNALTTATSLRTTGGGFYLFGESFIDLKDYMRRYMIYCAFLLTPYDQRQPGQCSYILPLLPQGLDLMLGTPSNIFEMPNRCRDGPTPIILSAFKYYRGGMRMRLVFPSTQDVIVWIQHRPDRRLRSREPIRCSDVTTAEGLANHGYATYVQDTGVNSIVEFEIPFYMNSAYGLLQRPMILKTNESFCFSLGELSIGFMLTNKAINDVKNFLCTCYYSVADDFNPSLFQGFPPMVFLDDIITVNNNDIAQPQGWGESIKKSIGTFIKDEAKEVIKTETAEIADKTTEQLEQIKKAITETAPTDVAQSSIFRSFVSNIAHMLANCNIKSIAIGIGSILMEIGIVCMNALSAFIEKLIDLLKVFKFERNDPQPSGSGTQPNQPDNLSEVATPHSPSPSTSSTEAATGIITIIWTSLCSLFCVANKKPKNLSGLCDLLTKDIKNCVSSGNAIFVFFRNIFSVTDSIKRYLLGIVCPQENFLRILSESHAEIKAWADEVLYVSDPVNFEKERFEEQFKLRVNSAFIRGKIIYQGILDNRDDKINPTLLKLYDKIHDTRQRLIEFGQDCFVRKEPFVLWQVGEAGIGKSTFATHLSYELLKHRNIDVKVPPIYNHEASSDFWDSCCGNPVMMVDDMFSIQEGPIFERHLALLFSVVSPVVLCPPKARLEDKGRPYNPEILIMNSNYDWLNFNAVDMDAIHRRRNLLFRVERSRVVKPGCDHCNNVPLNEVPVGHLADYHHIQFRIANNVLHQQQGWSDPMDYSKFMALVKQKYDLIMERNELLYDRKMQETLALMDTHSYHDVNTFQETFERIRDQQLLEYNSYVSDTIMSDVINAFKNAKDKVKADVSRVLSYMNLNFSVPVVPSKVVIPTISLSNNQSYSQMSSHEYIEMLRNRNARPQMMDSDDDMDYIDRVLNENEVNDIRQTLAHYQHHTADKIYNTYYIGNRAQKISDAADKQNIIVRVHMISSLVNLEKYGPEHFMKVDNFVKILTACAVEMDRKVVVKSTAIKILTSVPRIPLKKIIARVQRCRVACCHWFIDPLYCKYDHESKNIYHHTNKHQGLIVNQQCKYENELDPFCMWNNTIYKYLWFCRYVDCNPDVAIQSMYRLPPGEIKIPLELVRNENILIPSENTWRTSYEKARNAALSAYLVGKNTLLKFFNIFSSFCSWFLGAFGTIIKCIFVGVCVTTTSTALCSSFGLVNPSNDVGSGGWSEPQSPAYSNLKPNIKLNARSPIAKPQNDIPQFECAIKRLQKNSFEITAMYGDKYLKCDGIVIEGFKLLLLRHYLEEFDILPPETVFYGKFHLRKDEPLEGTYGVSFNFRDCERTYYSKVDHNGQYASNFVILFLPLQFQACKSLVGFIATEKLHMISNGDGVIFQNDGIMYDNIKYVQENKKPLVIGSVGASSRVVLQSVYTYRMQRRGMCGSVLLSRNLERPIIGIHVAGIESGNVRGVAEMIHFETFKELPPSKRRPDFMHVLPDMDDTTFSKLDIETAIYPYGCVDTKYSIHQGSESNLIHSEVAGVFPIRTEPAPLRINDPRLPKGCSPLKEGIAHMGKPPIDFPRDAILEAGFDLQRVIIQNVVPVRGKVGVIDLQDAICGNPNIEGFLPLEWSTSPGFPLVKEKDCHTQTGKKWLFDLDETSDGYILKGIHPKLTKLIETEMAMRKRNLKPFTIFVDHLKDDCLPIEKCKIPGKTRIFSISPIQFTIVFKQYFLDFMASYQIARWNAEHSIGIDVDSLQWTDLVNHLTTKGDKIICGDYKNYGPGLMLSVAEKAFEIILEWYKFHGDEQNNQVRRIMVYEIISAFHLASNLIYTTPCGIPSGSPITTPLNSLVGSIYARIIWKFTTNLSYTEFHSHCTIVTYGDDVCINISDDICEQFNTITMSEAFSDYSIVFTDADKTGELIKWRTLEQAQFLKRSFIPHPFRMGVWLAPLDKISIEGCANWINRKNNIKEATIQNCEQAVMLAHGWGEQYYNYVKDKLEKALYELGYTFRYDSWRELDRKRYSQLREMKVQNIKDKVDIISSSEITYSNF